MLKWRSDEDWHYADSQFPGCGYVIEPLHKGLYESELRAGDDDCLYVIGDAVKGVQASKDACQQFEDGKVAEIAAANGYVKLDDDEIVIKREHAKSCLAALDDTTRARSNPGDPTAYGHIQRALDASGVGK